MSDVRMSMGERRRGFKDWLFEWIAPYLVPALVLANLLAAGLLYRNSHKYWWDLPPSKRTALIEGVKRDGLWIGPFERPIAPVRLSDLSTAHNHCGPECPDWIGHH